MGELVRSVWPLPALRELWEYRELVRALVDRNLKVRYQRTILGILWALLNPLMTAVVLVVVFVLILRVQIPQYWAFLIAGYFPWVFTLHTLGTAGGIVTGHSYISRSVAFPPEALVVSAVTSRLVEFLMEMGLVVVVLSLFHHKGLTIGLLAVPVAIVLQTVLTAGLTMPIAALAVFFDDVQYVLPVVLMLLTLISPVYYPLSYAPESLQPVLSVNPFASVLTLYHVSLYEGRLPALGEVVVPAIVAGVVFVAGLAAFRWKRAYFAEIV